MKTIRKTFQGVMPENKILNSESNSQTDTYSCDYINNMKVDAENIDELPVGTRVEYNGTEVPDGWEEVPTYGDVYSEEETVIGTWFGKPLYRKAISSTGLINRTTILTVPHNVENMETFWIDNSHSFFLAISGLSYSLPMIGYQGNTSDNAYAYADETNIYVYSNGGWADTWTKVITLLYTKTTD